MPITNGYNVGSQINGASARKSSVSCWKTPKDIKIRLTKTRPAASQMMTKKDRTKC